MRLLPAGLVLLVLVSRTPAQPPAFPYEAVVASNAAEIHSGPGGRYYATGRLERGAAVTVHRHDPGGWYMIAPPPGSFSWIRAEYVKRSDSSRGELTTDNVVVRVGSSLDQSSQVEQIRLSSGDAIEILGEATLNTGPGPIRMYKIKPPRGEFRWIQGRHLVPTDPVQRERHDRNPFAIPSHAQRPVAGAVSNAARPAAAGPSGDAELPGFDRPIARSSSGPAVRQSGPSPAELAADRGRLEQLDDTFRRLVQQDIATWEFTGLEQEYRRLQSDVRLPALASQVELRLHAIARYRLRKQEHDDVTRLITETSRRDAELLAIQRDTAAAGPEGIHAEPASTGSETWQPTTGPAARLAPQPGQPQIMGVMPHSAAPGPAYGPQPSPSVRPPIASGSDPRMPRFDGAGIVQRAATTYRGAPRYVLLAPNGRVLSYLEPLPGLSLDAYVGQTMGVVGPRQHRRDLQADVIIVRGLTPVRLVPAP